MHFYGNNSSKTNYFVEKFVIVEDSTITKYRFKNGKSVSARSSTDNNHHFYI